MFLKVNEIFGPTIQGEGPSQGKEVMFIRLALCNLHCSWCDTPYTWNWKQYKVADEVHEMDNDVILKAVEKTRAVVISGGEPFLQQRNLLTLVGELSKREYWIEVETNGTIEPEPLFFTLLNRVNCSPKLSNSGESFETRIKPAVMSWLASSHKVFFKFVVGNKTDMDEVLELVQIFLIDPDRVYLMPLGKTREELARTTEMVRGLATQYGFHFSSRLHVELWGTKRGV
jgi:7-cyano-7-deazaguanosine (preQ0) biosynthesis protein QueE